MDLFGSLMSYFSGLIASSLIIIHLIAGSAYTTFASFVIQESPAAQISFAVPSPSVATSTKGISIAATTTPKTTPKKSAPTPVVIKIPAPVAAKPAPIISPDQINTNTRSSVVNILCSAAGDTPLRSISGSGVIIDSRGVILTNAHIGQYFLLKDAFHPNSVDCVSRTGSPAHPAYRATLLYLPPQWIDANASQITAEHALGTGEYDYAFLLINGGSDPASILPSSFTKIAMTTQNPSTGDSALVAAYPAGFLDGTTIERDLYATSAFTTIGQLYTFNSNQEVDVISLGGTVVSQGGSSGGAVVRTYDGEMTGLIATASSGTTTADRDLRAVTIDYINRNLTMEGKGGVVGLLSTDLKAAAADFNATIAPGETQKLLSAIK